MAEYVYMTDSDSDLPYHLKVQYDIPVVYMPYIVDGKEYFDDLGQTMDHKTYFDKMREGAAPSTAGLNELDYIDYFEPILESGKDLLFVAFSSQLSGTINNVYAARATLLEKYPERKFVVVDTLSISAPMTLLILKSHEMYRGGADIDTVAQWLENNKLRAQAWFTVDDLKYLKRGGRISSAAAAMGTMLDLKPVIVESREGKIVSSDKVRGRRKALNFIVDKTVENLEDPTESPIMVLHADAPADAEKVRDLIRAKVPAAEIMIANVGPVIGAHCGPGTVAIGFIGKERPI